MKSEARFQVGGVEFVSGLEWVTLDASGRERPLALGPLVFSGPGSASKKELSRIKGASSAVWRTTDEGVMQLGISTGKPGSISLASFAAYVLKHENINTFIAAFCIDESSYALVGVVDGLVQMTVELYGDEDEVRQRAQEELSVSDPDIVVIAPEGFGIGETRHDDIEDLIKRAEKADFNLSKLIRISPDYAKIGIVALSIAIAVGGSFLKLHWDKQKQEAEQMRIAQEMLRQQQAKALAQRLAKEKEPEINIFPVSQAVSACYQTFLKAERHPGGWKNISARCIPGDLALRFERDGSRIAFLRKTYPNATVSLDGKTAEVHIPAKVKSFKVKAKDLSGIDQISEHFNDAAVSFGFKTTIVKQAASRTTVLPGREIPSSKKMPNKSWKTFNWIIKGVPIGLVPKDFDFNGVSFKEMNITIGAGNDVVVKGEFYGK